MRGCQFRIPTDRLLICRPGVDQATFIEQQVAESFVVRCRPGIQTHRLLQDADRLAAPTQAL